MEYTFALMIREEMRAQGLTDRKLANKLGWAHSKVQRDIKRNQWTERFEYKVDLYIDALGMDRTRARLVAGVADTRQEQTPTDARRRLGVGLKRCREAARLSRDDVEMMLNLTEGRLDVLENGVMVPDAMLMRRLCQLYRCAFEDFFRADTEHKITIK